MWEYTKSCGCLSNESRKIKATTHGNSKSWNEYFLEYRSWQLMKRRCYNENDPYYFNYGGRGIVVCAEWKDDFSAFIRDMGKKPSINYTLDRIESNGVYEKSNCRWATKKQQSGNRRTNRWVEHEGRKMILQEWANELKVEHSKLNAFLRKNTISDAISRYSNPAHNKNLCQNT
jgi:hypothetical protein